MKPIFYCLLLFVVGCCPGCAPQQGDVGTTQRKQPELVTIADTGKFVIDTTGTLSPLQAHIEQELHGLYDKNKTQVKVLAIDTTNGEDIASFSQRTATNWGLGQKGKDNGVLVVLAIKDRKVRIQTGYGMEEYLPDSFCGELCRKARDNHFKKAQYADGIHDIVEGIIGKVGK